MISWYIIFGVASYLIGSIPFAYILVKKISQKDITKYGTGNIGAMNVKRSTGSWGWFALDVLLDSSKGIVPVVSAKVLAPLIGLNITLTCYIAILFAVLGHNYSIYMLPIKGRIMGGKGLATSGGAMLAYNWTFPAVALAIALSVIFITKYLLAGQIVVTMVMPIYVWLASPKDFWLVALICLIIFIKHAPRLPGLLVGKEPKWNVKDYRQAQG
ncbi:MAG TPA: glycerol-3-phosphate acyltransferase [Actinobacteria bacterium]|nr:glycerol-3-phosphate acyltransferase [Actinomycetota bacterium]